jgi:hypothetical protein
MIIGHYASALIAHSHEPTAPLALLLVCAILHHVTGPTTAAIGLNLYGRAPYLAIVIEAAFGACMVYLYGWSEARQGRSLSTRRRASLYAVFVLGALAMLPGAERSFHDWFP